MFRAPLLMVALFAAALAAASVTAGKLVDLGVLRSQHADPHRLTVWLPSSYRPGGSRHAVLYMHDGQNLFDTSTGFSGMERGVDETLDRLISAGEVRPTIVVGIWNTSKRLREYVPSKAFRHLAPAYKDSVRGLYGGDPRSDGYLKFIVHELKPRIQRNYRVRHGRADTVIMGSSMGGSSRSTRSTSIRTCSAVPGWCRHTGRSWRRRGARR